MDTCTEITKRWLDRRYRQVDERGIYRAHEPICGLGGYSERPQARRLVRLFQLLRTVRCFRGRSLLDVGGSEGFFGFACRRLFAMEVVSMDLSAEACRRALEIFSLPVLAVDSAALPFEDGSFDVITMTEVIEHLARPIHALFECRRVARIGVILSTEEWCATTEVRRQALASRSARDHMERSIPCPDDLPWLFAPHAAETREQWIPPRGESFEDDDKLTTESQSWPVDAGRSVSLLVTPETSSRHRSRDRALWRRVGRVQYHVLPMPAPENVSPHSL